MRKASVLLVVLVLWGTGLARAESAAGGPGAKLPPEVLVFAEVRDLLSAEAKLMDVVQQIAPDARMQRFTDWLPEKVFGTADPSTVDMSKPFQVVRLAPPYLHETVGVFSVTDAASYLDSIVPALAKQRDEGALHFYTRAGGIPVVIGIEGNRAVAGRTAEAVGKVLALVKSGTLSADPVFQGSDAGCMVRLKQFLSALDAEGGNPFDTARLVAGQYATMAASSGTDMRATVSAYLDGAEAVATQLDTVTVQLALDKVAATATVEAQPAAGSPVAGYLAQLHGGQLDLLKYLPADSLGGMGMKLGDIKPIVEWYGKVLAVQAPADQSASAQALAKWMAESAATTGDESAAALSRSSQGPLVFVSATKVKDVQALQRIRGSPERMESVKAMLRMYGMTADVKYNPKVLSYAGVDVAEWQITYDFPVPPGPFGQQQAAMQRAMGEALWGRPMMVYEAVKDDVSLHAHGAGSLDALKAMLDGPGKAIVGSEGLAAALQGMPEDRVAVGYLSLQGLAGFAVGAARKAMMPQMPQFSFAEAPAIGFAVSVLPGGALHGQLRVPVAAVRSTVDGFRTPAQPAEPFLMQP